MCHLVFPGTVQRLVSWSPNNLFGRDLETVNLRRSMGVIQQLIGGVKGCGVCTLAKLFSPQPAVHVATASASHRNEWHVPGSTGCGNIPTMPGTLSDSSSVHPVLDVLSCSALLEE